MPKHTLVPALALLVSPVLAAAEEPSLTLKDALGTAIVQNRTVRTASLDLEISEDNVYSQTGADDFLVAANANFTRSVKQVVPGQFVSFPETNTFHTDASLTKPLPFGARVPPPPSTPSTRPTSIFPP